MDNPIGYSTILTDLAILSRWCNMMLSSGGEKAMLASRGVLSFSSVASKQCTPRPQLLTWRSKSWLSPLICRVYGELEMYLARRVTEWAGAVTDIIAKKAIDKITLYLVHFTLPILWCYPVQSICHIKIHTYIHTYNLTVQDNIISRNHIFLLPAKWWSGMGSDWSTDNGELR